MSCETIQQANEFFDGIEEQLPKRISMPFVAFKILEQIVKSEEERYIRNYFWLQVPQGSVEKHKREVGAHASTVRCWCELRPNFPWAGKGGGKTIHERSSEEGLHPLAAPPDHKGPYAGAYRTLGRCFPHNTSIAWKSQGRETQGSPKDNAL